jgi:hypothetical protein
VLAAGLQKLEFLENSNFLALAQPTQLNLLIHASAKLIHPPAELVDSELELVHLKAELVDSELELLYPQ